MEVSNAMLVSMMFVMVLSIGIGNILMSLSALIDRRSQATAHWIPTTWLLLLLLQHLSLFWNTLAILEAREWDFAGFLYIVAGPVVLFLATALMLPGAGDESSDPSTHYFQVAPRFYALLALLMLWCIGAELVLADGLTRASFGNAALLALFLVLGGTRRRSVHAAVTAAAAALMVALFAGRVLGLIA